MSAGAFGQVQAFGELICNSENLKVEIYNVHDFMAPQTWPKPNIIPTSKLINCPYGILLPLWSGRNVEDWYLEFDEWYENHIKPKIQALDIQEDPLCHGDT